MDIGSVIVHVSEVVSTSNYPVPNYHGRNVSTDVKQMWMIDFLDISLSGEGIPSYLNQITVNSEVFTVIAVSPAEYGAGRAHFAARYFRDDLVREVQEASQLAFAIPLGWLPAPLFHLAMNDLVESLKSKGEGV